MSGWESTVLHADLDAFYASVEVLRDPALRGKPVIVGGTSSRGVVTSASYEARRFGVCSAMPTSRARRLCPTGIFIQPDFDAYTEYSHRVRDSFYSFSPVIERLSLDEAFIDVSGARRLWDTPAALATSLRREVRRRTGLVVSVGVASNKFLAKLASTKAKPDGMLVVEDVASFLDPLPVEDFWGVGEQTAEALRRLGLTSIGRVAAIPTGTLERALGSLGTHLAKLSRGEDSRPVTPDAPRKSLGSEQTFQHDLGDEEQILGAILGLADRVGSRLRSKGISGQTVTLKMRFSNFNTITRSRTLPHETDATTAIYRVAAGLLDKDAGRKRIRLLGISTSTLKPWPASEQLALDGRSSWPEADQALDRIRLRFGKQALVFGSLIQSGRS
ncbi:MAG: DNA polymerase IV [Actinomycetota bacterium]